MNVKLNNKSIKKNRLLFESGKAYTIFLTGMYKNNTHKISQIEDNMKIGIYNTSPDNIPIELKIDDKIYIKNLYYKEIGNINYDIPEDKIVNIKIKSNDEYVIEPSFANLKKNRDHLFVFGGSKKLNDLYNITLLVKKTRPLFIRFFNAFKTDIDIYLNGEKYNLNYDKVTDFLELFNNKINLKIVIKNGDEIMNYKYKLAYGSVYTCCIYGNNKANTILIEE